MTLNNQVIKIHEIPEWDKQADFVVAGFGGAGAVAALEGFEQGMDVLVLDRLSGGGSTSISGGIYYAGGGTRVQKEAGFEDTPENMFNYLQLEVQGAVKDETLKRFCDESVNNFDWLASHGVPFEASFCPYKTAYPSNQHYFYYSGNESFPPYSEHATPVPRGHRGKKANISGAAIYEPLKKSISRKPIQVMKQTKLEALVVNDNNEVEGIKVKTLLNQGWGQALHRFMDIIHGVFYYAALFWPPLFTWLEKLTALVEDRFGETLFIKAHKGVVLATGGFFANQQMLKTYAPKYLGGSPLGTMCDNGSGILKAMAMGAKTDLMDHVSVWRFINPPNAFVKGVLVGFSGKRVCNEMLYGAQIGERMMKEHNGKMWLVMDAKTYAESAKDLTLDKALWPHIVMGYFYRFLGIKKSYTLEGLASLTGINEAQLIRTINLYNENARSPEPDPMGKPKENVRALDQGPFYAVNVSYDYFWSPCASLTFGGLKVDEESGLVIHENGNVIKGLYAAGRTAVGIPSKGYVSGLSIADCVFSGRRAAKHAANEGDKSVEAAHA